MGRGGAMRYFLLADASGVKKGAKEAESALAGVHVAGTKALSGLGTAAAGAGLALGAGGLVSAIDSTVRAAEDAQASQAKVETALKNAGISYAQYGKQIDQVIQKQSQLTGFDDEDLAESFSNMVRTTHNVSEAFKLNALAADIARTKGMDLAGAQSLLARVYNGAFQGVKRLGIAITPVTAAQDALKASTKKATEEQVKAAKAADALATRQEAIGKLQQTFGGQAEAYGKTAAGAVDRYHVAVENLQESIGGALLPVLASLANTLAGVANWGERNADVLKMVAQAVFIAGSAVTGYAAGVKVAEAATTAWSAVTKLVAAELPLFGAGATVAAAGTTALAAAETEATVATEGLSTAIKANPVGLIVAGVAAAAAALWVLSSRESNAAQLARELKENNEKLAESARAVASAIHAQADAISGLHHANIGVKQASLDLSRAQKQVNDDVRAGRKGTDDYKQHVIDLQRAEADYKDALRSRDDAQRKSVQTTVDANGKIKDGLGVARQQLDMAKLGSRLFPTVATTQEALAAAQANYNRVAGEAPAKLKAVADNARDGAKQIDGASKNAKTAKDRLSDLSRVSFAGWDVPQAVASLAGQLNTLNTGLDTALSRLSRLTGAAAPSSGGGGAARRPATRGGVPGKGPALKSGNGASTSSEYVEQSYSGGALSAAALAAQLAQAGRTLSLREKVVSSRAQARSRARGETDSQKISDAGDLAAAQEDLRDINRRANLVRRRLRTNAQQIAKARKTLAGIKVPKPTKSNQKLVDAAQQKKDTARQALVSLKDERASLISSLADLIAEAHEAGFDIGQIQADLKAPTDQASADTTTAGEVAAAQAQLTPGTADDIAAQQTIVAERTAAYAAAVASGKNADIVSAAGALKQAQDDLANLLTPAADSGAGGTTSTSADSGTSPDLQAQLAQAIQQAQTAARGQLAADAFIAAGGITINTLHPGDSRTLAAIAAAAAAGFGMQGYVSASSGAAGI